MNSDNDILDKFHSLVFKELIEQEKVKSCLNCLHLTDSNAPAHCALYNAIPPAKTVVYGCDAHDFLTPF